MKVDTRIFSYTNISDREASNREYKKFRQIRQLKRKPKNTAVKIKEG